MPSAGNVVTVAAADSFVAFGDSITDPAAFSWPTATGGLRDQINAQFTQPAPSYFTATATGGRATATGGRATCSLVSTTKSMNYVANTTLTAQSGWTSGNLLAQLPTALTTYRPKVALLLIGINDIANGGSPTSPVQANINSILDDIHAADATTSVIVMSILAHWEQWSNAGGGSAWGPNTDDASIATLNTFLAGLPGTRSYVTYIDVRTPLLAGEVISNTSPVVGNVVGAQDGVYIFQDTHGVHPLTNLKLLMAQEVMKFISVTP